MTVNIPTNKRGLIQSDILFIYAFARIFSNEWVLIIIIRLAKFKEEA